MRRYVVLIASVVIQICLGGTYAWSAFVPALSEKYGLSSAQTQTIFGVTIAVLTLSMVLSGRLQDRYGPRLVAMIGAALYACGYVLASFSHGAYPLLLLEVGFIVGAGIGFVYVCSLATCIKWFPERKGLITGVAVAGYGAGAIVLSYLATALFARGLDVLEIFRWIGLCYGVVVFLGALLLSVPATASPAQARVSVGLGEVLGHRAFWGLAVGVFCGTCAGVIVIGNLKPMGLHAGVGLGVATTAISALAVGNALGRISWGLLYDRWGQAVIPLSLLFLAGADLALLGARGSGAGLLLAALAVGLGYGACVVLYAARVASVWGPERVGSVYPMVMLFHGAAAFVAPALGGRLFDVTGDFTLSLLLAASTALVGAAAVWMLMARDAAPPTPAVTSEAMLMVEPPD